MPVLTAVQVAQYAYQAGISEREPLATSVAITSPESGRNTAAHNPDASTGDNSYGLWQINMLGSLGPARRAQFGLRSNEELLDPAVNATAMAAISSGGRNWNPWTTYKDGLHRPYMAEAYAAADQVLRNPPGLLDDLPGGGNPLFPAKPPGEVITELPPGLGASYVHRDFYLAGKSLEADVSEALTDARLRWSIDGVPNLEWTLADPHRKLLRSKLFTERSVTHVDGIPFELTRVRKTTTGMILTFDHVAVALMRDNTLYRKVAGGAMTRKAFLAALVAEEQFLVFKPAPPPMGEDLARVEMARGEPDPIQRLLKPDENENTWEAGQRLADEVGWRFWVLGWNEVHYAPDDWLMFLPPAFTLKEGENGVDNILFEYDKAKPMAELKVTCRPGRLKVYPGQCCEVVDEGVADGRWIVRGYERSLFRAEATLTLMKGRPDIPEPPPEADKQSLSLDEFLGFTEDSGGSIFGDGTGTGTGAATYLPPDATADQRRDAMMAFAEAQVGDLYVLGANGPDKWDCSGFVLGCFAAAGIRGYPRVSTDIAMQLGRAGMEISMGEGINTKGAVLYQKRRGPDDAYAHIALSMGDGERTVEAMGSRYGVTHGKVRAVTHVIGSEVNTSWRFDSAYLVPGIHTAEPGLPSSGPA